MDYAQIHDEKVNTSVELLSQENENVSLYPITKAYYVFLKCPDCGTDMDRLLPSPTWRYESHGPEVYFDYICTNCGKRVQSKTQYPFQHIEYKKDPDYHIISKKSELYKEVLPSANKAEP